MKHVARRCQLLQTKVEINYLTPDPKARLSISSSSIREAMISAITLSMGRVR